MLILWRAKIICKILSEANISEHWGTRKKRHDEQKEAILSQWNKDNPEISLPCTIHLYRVYPRFLDSGDNLPISLKHCRDTIADLIIPGQKKGRADNDPRLSWEYSQRKPFKNESKGLEMIIYVNG